MTLRSYLGKHVPSEPTSDDAMIRMRAKAWHEHGVFVVPLCDVENAFERQFLENMGVKLYGKRAGDPRET